MKLSLPLIGVAIITLGVLAAQGIADQPLAVLV